MTDLVSIALAYNWTIANTLPTVCCCTLYCCRAPRNTLQPGCRIQSPDHPPPPPRRPPRAPAAHLPGLTAPRRSSADVEGQFLADVAQRRWPVLIFIFCFDVFCYMLRLGARLAANVRFGLVELAAEMGPQLANMGFCYLFLGLVNTRSRRGGGMASRQVIDRHARAHFSSLHASRRPLQGHEHAEARAERRTMRWLIATCMAPTSATHAGGRLDCSQPSLGTRRSPALHTPKRYLPPLRKNSCWAPSWRWLSARCWRR